MLSGNVDPTLFSQLPMQSDLKPTVNQLICAARIPGSNPG